MAKSACHYVDSDITGTSGLDSWTSNNYSYPSFGTVTGISSAEELAKIGVDPAYPLDGDYELTADIDLSGYPNWTPIAPDGADGASDTFTGSFDGNYFTISNLTQTSFTRNLAGLFGWLGSGSLIEKFRVLDADINISTGSTFGSAGVLAAVSYTSGVTSCSQVQTSGTIQGKYVVYAGGLIGQSMQGSLSQCMSSVDITINSDVNPSDTYFAAGLVGYCPTWGSHGSNHPTLIMDNCYATGDMTVTQTYAIHHSLFAAGLVGFGSFLGGSSTNCYASGNCYAASTYSNSNLDVYAAGYFGQSQNSVTHTIDNCFGYGEVSGSVVGDSILWTGGFFAGITGLPETNTHYVDNGNNAQSTATKQTQAYFQDENSGVYDDWDFNNVWEMDSDTSLPKLQWLANNPYQTKTGEQNRTTAMPEDYSHLEGESVQLLQDGVQTANQTVTSGSVTTTGTVNHVGLQIDTKIQPMKIDGISEVKRIGTIIPDFYETSGGKHGDSETNLYSNSLKDGDDLDPDEALFSGHVDLPFDGGYTRELDLWFTQTAPLPLHLRGVGVRLSAENI